MPGTPVQKFTTTTSGPYNEKPVAILAVTKIDALIGSIVQLDGRKSYDPEKQPLSWKWKFNQTPIGSTVEDTGFRDIRPHGSAVSFIPDKIGIYVVELVVNDGELDSDPITATINIQISRVPCGENIVPDAHFLWSYISNFWSLVEDREMITSIWSSTIQAIGAELIKLWDADNNKSLATIQGTSQRRWLPFYSSSVLIDEDDQRIIVGKTDSGTGGSTGNIGEVPSNGNTRVFYLPLGAVGDVTATDLTNLEGNYGAKGRVIAINGEGYTIQRVSNENLILWSNNNLVTTASTNQASSVGGSFQTAGAVVGDWLIVKSGPDAGTYLITNVPSETELELAHLNGAPVSFSGASDASFEVARPYTVAVVDEEAIPDGQVGTSWRVPHLLHIPSVNFEDIGTRPGDVLVFEVTRGDLGLSTELRCQIVAVDRTRLGFEMTLSDLEDAAENIDRTLFEQVVQDLKIVSPTAPSSKVVGAARAVVAFMPTGINLSTRPFSTHRITFKAKKIIHNKIIMFDENLVSVPALQEELKDPAVVLRENLDYVVENGYVEFIGGLFNPQDPAPDVLWAECALFDNSGIIEQNFGRLVNLSQDNLSAKQTRAPYLSAVKGLFFAYTNGPTIANIRLGLQILLGLPFTEEKGVILELQDDFTVGTDGQPLGRLLMEDIDDSGVRSGVRRIYFYPTTVGLETNPVTGDLYKVGDVVEQFRPLSKGVEVQDYVKDPRWWVRALYGLEVLKYFTFKITVDGDIFDSNDVKFAFEFVKSIKPAYTKVISTALLSLYDDIEVTDALGGAVAMKFYDNYWGLEATNRAGDDNHQGVILWSASSKPFHTRTKKQLKDVKTFKVGAAVRVSSVAGWDTDLVRARPISSGIAVIEGDLLFILAGQEGAGSVAPGIYEIGDVIDENNLELLTDAPAANPTTYSVTPLDADLFEYGSGLKASIMRRMTNPMMRGTDLDTNVPGDLDTNIGTSLSADFVKNSVAPGCHLIIESGDNRGEYIIDQLPNPVPEFITDTQVALKNLDGTTPVLQETYGQTYRVIEPKMQDLVVYNARSVYRGGRIELEVLDPITGDPFDVFTPGMLGTTVHIANSDESANDGGFIITDYVDCGTVALDNPSSTSDSVAQATIYF